MKVYILEVKYEDCSNWQIHSVHATEVLAELADKTMRERYGDVEYTDITMYEVEGL